MKKKYENEITNNIILNDKELEVLIRKLITQTNCRGFEKKDLLDAVKVVWKNEIKEDDHKKMLTLDELDFVGKVDKFLQYYGDMIVFTQKQYEYKMYGGICAEKLKESKKEALEKYARILVGIYGVFQKEDSVSQKKVCDFVKSHYSCSYKVIGDEIKVLEEIFYYRLDYSTNEEFPVFMKEYKPGCKMLNEDEEFKAFADQYVYCTNLINRLTVAVVWFIGYYF